jgi:hypothetical protein
MDNMKNIYYKTNFNLKCPVLNIQEADDYLRKDDMTKYLLDDLRSHSTASPEEIGKIEEIYWTMNDRDSGSVVLVANDRLLPATLSKISEWVSGQCSDGLGEDFEQQPFASYQDKYGGYYDDDDNWVDADYCMASFDYNTNDYKFTQVNSPAQKIRENKVVGNSHHVLRSDEFVG